MKTLILSLTVILTSLELSAQQKADSLFNSAILSPVYEKGAGPEVFIDETHNNFHKLNGRYRPFANLLEKDGYNLRAFTESFSKADMKEGKILVIANALHESNISDWTLPTPSAFTKEEIEVGGWSQGAFMRFGKGRIAVFGEAAMFTT